MKKSIMLAFALTFSLSAAVPAYALHADRPYDEAARTEAAAYISALTRETANEFLNGDYTFGEYEVSVSESYVNNFIAEASSTPMFKDFDLNRYTAEISPRIMFLPHEIMFLVQGYAYEGKIAINFGRDKETTDDFKHLAAHEMLHLGTDGLAMVWLDEAFAVLGARRIDEAVGREAYTYGESERAYMDYRIGELLAELIGGEDAFARMAGERNAHELIGQAFDAAQGYVTFDDFSFANASIRVNDEEEDTARNLGYLEYIVNNPQPSEDDEKAAEIREFYSLPTRETAVKYADGMSVLLNGYKTPAECLDTLTRRVFQSASDNTFYSAEDESLGIIDDAALKLAYELISSAPVSPTPGEYFIFADAVTALKLTRFVDDNGVGSNARGVMKDAEVYALVGKLVELVFTGEGLNAENVYEEMERVFVERTGQSVAVLFAPEKVSAEPGEMLRQVIDECFVKPVVSGSLDKEKAVRELSGYREANLMMLEGRGLIELVDEGIAAVQ